MIVRKFYASINAILSHVKYASEMSKLFLVETFCLPVLRYSCECINLSKKQPSQLNVCCNNIYRKIFNMNLWESVKELCERVDFVHLYAERKLKLIFVQKLLQSGNE